MDAIHKLTRLSTILAFSLAAFLSFGIPAGYFFLGYQNQRGVIETEAYMNSILLSQSISKSPDYWRYEERKLAEVLTHHTSKKFDELRSIVDTDNMTIARTGEAIAPPSLTVSHNLYDSGNVVGRIEIATSLRPLIINTILSAIFALIFGLAIFSTLKYFPLRALSKALQSVYEEKEKALSILNNIPDIAWLKDRNGRYLAANGPFRSICGVSADDLPGKTDLDLWPLDLAEHYQADDREVLETGKPKQLEENIIDSEGRMLWISTIKTPIFSDSGEVIGTTGIARDFSERKLMEEVLIEREEKLRTITNTAQDAIIVIDHEGNISFWNPASEKIFGYSSSDAVGKKLHALLAPKRYHEAHRKAFTHFRETGEGMAVGKTLELDAVRKGGEEFPIELSLSALQTRDSWHAVGVIRDITERKRVVETLKKSEENFRTLFETSPDGIAQFDLSGQMIMCNSRNAMMLGYGRPDELIGKNVFGFVAPAFRQDIVEAMEFLIKTGKPKNQTEEFAVLKTNGDHFPAEVTGALVCDSEGKPSAIIVILRDITERKQAEDKILKLNESLELKVQDRTKQLIDAQEELLRKEKLSILGQLSGSVGHELRNPLGVMNNAVYFLKMVHADADETTKEYLDIIKHEIDNSQRIITDLLDFARTRTPQTTMMTASQLLGESLAKCIIPENIAVKTEMPDTLPRLRIDPLQMGQVFQNLLVNAIQAMPNGGELRVSAHPVQSFEKSPELHALNVEPDADFIEISIEDTGEGISPENMKKLFQPLFTTKAKGIGLGLVVCKNLVEANGGRIQVESELGKGTTFRVILPTAQ